MFRGEEQSITSGNSNVLLVSYLTLRKSVGILGVSLPLTLPLGVAVFGSAAVFQDSISDYFGTVMRGVFVGTLSAIAVFLFSYVGYEPEKGKKWFEPSDNLAGNLACVFALGVALFPTTSGSKLVRVIHFVSAALLFMTLAYFSLNLFTKSNDNPSPQKKTRNKVYRFCGWFILACIAAIALYSWFLQDTDLEKINPVFWLEALALWAFGWAWFVKGEGLVPLNDPEPRAAP